MVGCLSHVEYALLGTKRNVCYYQLAVVWPNVTQSFRYKGDEERVCGTTLFMFPVHQGIYLFGTVVQEGGRDPTFLGTMSPERGSRSQDIN